MTEHEKYLKERQERQFAIVRRGLREAARVLLEMEESLAVLDEPEFDMSELEAEVQQIYQDSDVVIDVTDEMIVDTAEYLGEPDKEPTVLDKLEGLLAGVQRRQYIRDTFS